MPSPSSPESQARPGKSGLVATASLGTIVGLGAAVAVTLLGRGSLDYEHWVTNAALFGGAPALVIALILLRLKSARPLGLLALAVALITFLAALAIPAGSYLFDQDVAAAKSYCDALVPALDKHKADKGAYPAAIAAVSPPAPRPRLLPDDSFYQQAKDGYAFGIRQPGSDRARIHYYSATKAWTQDAAR